MAKIYVSLPMKGKEQSEIVAAQQALLERAGAKLQEPVELLQTCFPQKRDIAADNPEAAQRALNRLALGSLAKALGILSGADYAVFGKGWDQARGCKIERLCAEQYGVPILDLD